jgi:uncharacterized protein YndB with AHSA1/START domain
VNSRVLVSLRVAATPEHAFAVFTQQIGAWWQPNALFKFTPRTPGVMSFEPGLGGRFLETLASGEVFEIGRVVAWVPGRRLAFSWRQASFAAGETTHVEVRFEPVGNQTRVTVEHQGWDTVPQEHIARHGFPDAVFLRRHAEWWQAQLAALKEKSAHAVSPS